MKRMFIVGSDAFLVTSMRLALRYAAGINVFGILASDGSVREAVRDSEADVVLLDGRAIPDRVAAHLREVAEERPQALVVVLVEDLDDELVETALDAGALVCRSTTALLPKLQALLDDEDSVGQPQVGLVAGTPAIPATLASQSSSDPAEPERPNADNCPLTARELQILRAVAEGHTNARIGRDLWVTEQTVKFHLSNIYRKLGVSNRTEASRYALLNDLFSTRRSTGVRAHGNTSATRVARSGNGSQPVGSAPR